MPISATGSKREAGFTLVELMVTITIMALAAGIIVATMPDPRGRVTADAERFAARAKAARDTAIIEARDMRIRIGRDGYAIDQRRRGAWVAMRDRPFDPQRWSDGTAASAGTITFDSTGAASTPQILTLVRDAERATVSIDGNGVIRVGS